MSSQEPKNKREIPPNDVPGWAYDDLLPATKAVFTRESWGELLEDAKRSVREEARRRPRLPVDWVEPSMTLEQVEADQFCSSLAEEMRRKGIDRITRSQYLLLSHGNEVPSPWTAEDESEVPSGLQDWHFLTIDRRLGRRKRDEGEIA